MYNESWNILKRVHSVIRVFVHRAFSIRLKNFWAESASLRYSQPCDKLTKYFVKRGQVRRNRDIMENAQP